MIQQFRVLLALLTDKHQVVTLRIRTVFEVRCLGIAMRAFTDRLGMVREIDRHALIEYP